MSRELVPVVVPVRSENAEAIRSMRVSVVAESAESAAEQAQLLGEHWLRLNGEPRAVAGFGEAGKPARTIAGAHAYVLGPGGISVLEFPNRFDSHNGEQLGEAFAELDEAQVYGVVLDCSALVYINTVGLTGIAAHLKRLRIQSMAVPPPIARVFEIVGLTQFMNVHATLEQALEAIS